ncbi:MAG: regulatory protein YycI of two-component signal transduction system YycFG [Sulfurimonas sp.]|jgi:regulatory protein YycI of two-component signal transduction system YycFG
MTLELMIELAGFIFILISNIILVTVFISKQNSRIKVCEDKIEVLFTNDRLHSDELKTLNKIEGQLELLIKHFMNK